MDRLQTPTALVPLLATILVPLLVQRSLMAKQLVTRSYIARSVSSALPPTKLFVLLLLGVTVSTQDKSSVPFRPLTPQQPDLPCLVTDVPCWAGSALRSAFLTTTAPAPSSTPFLMDSGAGAMFTNTEHNLISYSTDGATDIKVLGDTTACTHTGPARVVWETSTRGFTAPVSVPWSWFVLQRE
jgi:hypothetical protein